ncbi:hypothetical protein PIB30_008533 [Stylosanthes scabra]|uniref:Ubiquitin-like protease family profile domain-containing protein n=1 Tax=Stylosanthes scabra TaxID=79078 RepID=A0ABU6Z6X0_9FABA|nr:hypothetical protein [Stylosanthes scabra]
MRYHFMSLGEKAEVDMTIMDIICIMNNMQNNEKFKFTTCCVPPLFLHRILESCGRNFISAITELPHDITTLENINPLHYIDENKMKSAPFSSVLDQMRVLAGAETIFPNKTRAVGSHSLLPKYIPVPRQPNAYDCGVYVKYMDYVNPSILGKRQFSVPIWTEAELQEFREENVEWILYHGDNYYRYQAIKVANSAT